MICLSVLRRCWLGSKKGIQTVENRVVGCWRGYLSGARCRFAYDSADVDAIHCLFLQEIQIGFCFTFLVLAHPGSPGQNPENRKTVAVVVVVVVAIPYLFS